MGEPVGDKKNLENVVLLSQRKNLFLEGIANCAKCCCFVKQMVEGKVYVRLCNMKDKSNFGKVMKTSFFSVYFKEHETRECRL